MNTAFLVGTVVAATPPSYSIMQYVALSGGVLALVAVIGVVFYLLTRYSGREHI